MIDQVRPADLAAWFANQGATKATVLDVREPNELRAANVRASGPFEVIEIPMMEVPQRLAELDADAPLAVLCHHGTRSQRVAMFLAGNGFNNVANVAGGIDAWSQELDPAVPKY